MSSVTILAWNFRGLDLLWHLIGFYGQLEIGRHHESWALLKSLKSSSTLPWVCLGDFNEITKQSEKMGYKGPRFTFVRKHHDSVLRERLDRVLMNHAWEEQFPGSISHHLLTVRSDHSTILLKVQRRVQHVGRKGDRQFRFENYWLNDDESESIVREAWSQEMSASMMDRVLAKIARCGVLLPDWSAHKFGNLPGRIKKLQSNL
ncbi:hypothetical protein SLEP1_g43353 [Rubroshorea leprosula]|uniref:Endonuclease/exonuclease/phosphatase domain-containing protein n=1 Tax=Rubroshorea leprosula TaxID=152421 RepID=A0AAV5LCQ9_9ROSI|nr:hypothetical protein SLEP1_g43353 [Rubroshorea leprosula]